MYPRNLTQGLIALTISLAFAACSGPAQKPRAQKGQMDTPEFHQTQGDKHLLEGDYEGAKRAYNLALELDGKHSKSQSGLAVALAYLASGDITEETKQETFEKGQDLLDNALSNAKTEADTAKAHVNAVRFYVVTERPADKWYDKAKDHFDDAKSLTPDDPEPYFFMASAEAGRLNYEEATVLYKRVLSIGRAYDVEADQELKRIQQIQRALPGSRFGEKIANLASITRADTAALLLAELRLDRLYVSQSKQSSPSFVPPAGQQGLKLATSQRMPDATDLTGHPLKDSVEMVIRLGLKGLEPDAAHKFHPSESLTRAEFAMVIQDLLVKITKDETLESKFIGEPSPFSDVADSLWYYNAAQTVVTRGLMQPDASGKFNPMGKVSGADALLAIRNLKSVLKNY